MRIHTFSWVLALTLTSSLAVIAVPAGATFYVDPAGDDTDDCLSPATACLTIQAAIDKAPDGETIEIAPGTYAEQVIIGDRESLRLHGAPGVAITDPGLPLGGAVFHIQASRLIRLEELAISGNPAGVEAVRIFNSQTIDVERSTIEGANLGFFVNTSDLTISDSLIQDNGLGVRVDRGSAVNLNSTPFSPGVTTVRRNETGAFVRDGSLRLHGATVIEDNNVGVAGEGGVIKGCCEGGERQIVGNGIGFLTRGDHLTLQGETRIEANGIGIFMFGGQAILRPGLRLLQNETAIIDVAGHLQTVGVEIADSVIDGIVMADNASGRLQGTTVTGSGDDGIELDTLSTIRIFDTVLVEGNGGADLVCANGSMVRGELDGVRKVSCRRAE